MPFIHLLMTALSLSAIAGGTWTVDRAMERYGRIPAAQEVMVQPNDDADEEDGAEDPRIF